MKINRKMSEHEWLENIKKILDKYGNLYINDIIYKNDLIGKYLKKYGKQCLILGMCSFNIIHKIAVVDETKYFTENSFMNALWNLKDYKLYIMNINSFIPPTEYEKYLYNKYKDWKIINITNQNKNKKIRQIGSLFQ